MRERRCALQSAKVSGRAALGLWLTLGMVACPAVRAGQAAQGAPIPPGPGNKTRAESAIREGARAYAARDFLQAQAHYQAALELDPTQKNAAFFLARSIHAQYRPGLKTPENIAKAREAIAAYQRVVADNPNQDEAYEAVVLLYGALHEDAQLFDWVLKRARLKALSPEKRAAAYTVLAGKDWECASRLLPAAGNSSPVANDAKAAPGTRKDYGTAKQCARRGLEMAEQAIGLKPESEAAWSYKARLLLEMARLAGQEGQTAQEAGYAKQAATAQARTAELIEKNRKKMEAVKSY